VGTLFSFCIYVWVKVKKTYSCPKCGGISIRKGVRRGKIKFLCKSCLGWFQINRKRKEDNRTYLLAHLAGESFRSIAEIKSIGVTTAHRRYKQSLKNLPHCADITRKYCSRFSGILLVDGKYIKIKVYDKKIPVVYGIDYLTHDIPTYILSVSENYQTMHKFFSSLRLLKYPLQSIISDDNQNIFNSCLSVYPKAITQLCQKPLPGKYKE